MNKQSALAKHKSVRVPEGAFRMPQIPIIATLFALSAVAGLISLILLFKPWAFLLLDANPLSYSAKITWTAIHIFLLLFGTFWSALMAMGLFSILLKMIDKGMGVIAQVSRILRILVTVIALAMIPLFVYRTICYAGTCLRINGGFIDLFSGMLAEVICAGIAAAVVLFMRRFLDTITDTASSVSHTITTRILRRPSISHVSYVGFLILGLVRLYQCWNRFTTASLWSSVEIPNSYLLMLRCAGVMFLLGGGADILLCLCLRKYKQTSEYLLFKGTPADKDQESNEAN